jgi:predicted nucleic acid-binding protein
MTTSSERVLLDTNIFVFAANADAPQHAVCAALYERARKGEIAACITPQVLIEYVAVVTAKRVLPTPMRVEEALADVAGFIRAFPLLTVPHDQLDRTLALVRQIGITDRIVFDAALAATMLANGVTTIYTDDQRFPAVPGLTILRP